MKLYAKKSLGQHFLNSKHVLGQIIEAGKIQSDENILEIGPGTGFLTEALLKTGANIVAVEKDKRAYDLLQEKFSKEISFGKLKLIYGDILDEKEFSNNSIVKLFNSLDKYSLIANIPYYITGAILEKFLEHKPRPQKMVLLVQKEVADRIVARQDQSTRKSKESILSISVKVFGTPKIIAKVSPGSFTPPPSVDSAILSIENISDKNFFELLDTKPDVISDFFKIVKAGFAHKRKILRRNMEDVVDKTSIEQIWDSLKLDQNVRAEDLKPSDWVDIIKIIKK